MTIHLDDISAGERFTTARRTLTEADMMAFAGVTGDFNALHTDEIFAREETPFGRRIVHGPLILGLSFGLHSVRDDWKILALMECRRRFLAPTFPGDTVHGRYTVEAVRESASKPQTGFVTLAVEIVNQRDEVVQEGTDVLMIAREAPPV
jgi:3-hydroxybutyryl-CoA dehydratase